MIIAGLFVAFIIGIILGLVGGGGAILSIPLLVYFFGETTDDATTYSLVIVTLASLVGVLQRLKKDIISYKDGWLIAIPSMIVAFLVRHYRKNLIPAKLQLFGSDLTRDYFIDVLFVLVLLVVVYYMFRRANTVSDKIHKAPPYYQVIQSGIIVGALSGFLGAGGGFIIVPILLSMGLDIKKAVGTSMFVIIIQSTVALIGDFTSSAFHFSDINWNLALIISFLSIIGVVLGSLLQERISAKLLKKIFAFILLILAILIFIDRILLFSY